MVGSDVTFRAGQINTLTPGFEVQAGATFVAQIGPCQNPSGAVLDELSATARINNEKMEAQPISTNPEMAQTPLATTMELTIQPNPANHEAFIELRLSQPERVRLTLFNQNGQQLKTLITDDYPINQISNYRLQVGYLPNGLYFIHAASANDVQVQKLVVQ